MINRHIIKQLQSAPLAAAVAALPQWGRGDKEFADKQCVDAMRQVFNQMPDFKGRVVIGEGAKDEAPQLYNGEIVGNAHLAGEPMDIAVDPLECTTYFANGMGNSLSVLAVARPNSMMDVGPSFYMDKIVYNAQMRGKIDPESPIEDQLQLLAKTKGKHISELTIYILNKERHKDLKRRIHGLGCRIAWYDAGDVAGALMAMLGEYPQYDALLGIGGTPEGILCATAAQCLGAEMFCRFHPLSDSERADVQEYGLNTKQFYHASQLVKDTNGVFFAAGITPGLIHREGVHGHGGQFIVPLLTISNNNVHFSHEQWPNQ